MPTIRNALLVVLSLTVLACSGKDGDKKPPKPVSKDAGAVKPAIDAAPRVQVPRIPDGYAKVGIEVCDEYVAKQRKCLEEGAPKKIRKQHLLGLRKIAAKWAEAAKDRREHLEKTCSHMIESSKNATAKSWGCKW